MSDADDEYVNDVWRVHSTEAFEDMSSASVVLTRNSSRLTACFVTKTLLALT
jgi:hypothetical protein